MTDDAPAPDAPVKPKRVRIRKHSEEYKARTEEQKRLYEANRKRRRKAAKGEAPPPDEDEEQLQLQLRLLEKRTRGNPTDADGDIDFAYRNMALPSVTPLMAPSMSGWSWYIYSRTEPNKFLEICAKREDAKAKMAGTITNQRMEDDKRNQFAVLDRLEKALTLDVAAMVNELMEKFPEDCLRACRRHDAAWKAFLAAEPQ